MPDLQTYLQQLQTSTQEPGELNPWLSANRQQIAASRQQISAVLTGEKKQTTGQLDISSPSSNLPASPPPPPTQTQPEAIASSTETTSIVKPTSTNLSNLEASGQATTQLVPTNDRVVRVNAENLNRIMGLAGESLIEAYYHLR